MRAKITGNSITFFREAGDKKVYAGGGWGKSHGWEAEHILMHRIVKWLNERGFNLIKKRMSSDGHLYGDSATPYIRPPHKQTAAQLLLPQIQIYDGDYAIRNANLAWNQGEVTFLIEHAYKPESKRYQAHWQALISEDVRVWHNHPSFYPIEK